jgi:hypothetical protein
MWRCFEEGLRIQRHLVNIELQAEYKKLSNHTSHFVIFITVDILILLFACLIVSYECSEAIGTTVEIYQLRCKLMEFSIGC